MAGDRDKEIRLELDGKVENVKLAGGDVQKLNNDPAAVTWGNVYKYTIAGERFNGNSVGVKNDNWSLQNDLKVGKTVKIPTEEKESVYLLHEIKSSREQDVLVELGVADGIQVTLNGETVLLRTYVGGIPRVNETVKLHLQKGDNQLVVKLHNRYGSDVTYLVNPNVKQEEYKLRLKPMKLYPGQIHDCSLGMAHPANKNSDVGLRDLRVEIE